MKTLNERIEALENRIKQYSKLENISEEQKKEMYQLMDECVDLIAQKYELGKYAINWKVNYIHDMLYYISISPDEIQQRMEIKWLSRQFDIPEDVLLRKFFTIQKLGHRYILTWTKWSKETWEFVAEEMGKRNG